MQLSLQTVIWLPVGLGLLGFIEPCTIGGHLFFLDAQASRNRIDRVTALVTFIAARATTTGAFGAGVVSLGRALSGIQTGIWLVFGVIYVLIGMAFILGGSDALKYRINLSPAVWKQSRNPIVMGLALGLNIPACAAPILFGLLGFAATTGTVLLGFTMMFLFGLFLSLPLAFLIALPSIAGNLKSLHLSGITRNWIWGTVFMGLGFWSIWFAFFVDPANWSGT